MSEFNKEYHDKIKQIGRKNKNEICGFICLCDDDKIEVIEGKNYAADKKNLFIVHPLQYLEVKDKYKSFAVYHTHTKGNSKPSDYDKDSSQFNKLPYLIYSSFSNTFDIYFPENVNKEDYLWLQ